jgi:hypothetical protein
MLKFIFRPIRNKIIAEVKGLIFAEITRLITMRNKFQNDKATYMRFQTRITTLTDLRDSINEHFNIK